MNKERLKRLYKIALDFERLQGELDAIIEEETEAYDNTPESLQQSERGGEMLEGIEFLTEAAEKLIEAFEGFDNFDYDSIKTKKQKDIEKEEEERATREHEDLEEKEKAKAKIQFLMAAKALEISQKLRDDNK